MVVAATEPMALATSEVDGVRFKDAHNPDVYMDVMPQAPSGNVEFELGEEDGEFDNAWQFVTLSVEQRRTLAAVLLGLNEHPHGAGQPVQAPGKMRVVMETGADDWAMTPADFDYMWARAGWHVRNGIPGFIKHPTGSTVSIHEVGEGDKAPRGMSETRRHYRYLLKGDKPDAWRYHNNYNHVRKLNPVVMEMQRSYRSEWREV